MLLRGRTTIGAAVFDDEGGLMWMSESLRNFLCYGADEDLSSAILVDFYEEPEYERILQEVYPRLVENGWWSDRIAMRTKDGRLLETHHRIEARVDASGRFLGLAIRVENY